VEVRRRSTLGGQGDLTLTAIKKFGENYFCDTLNQAEARILSMEFRVG